MLTQKSAEYHYSNQVKRGTFVGELQSIGDVIDTYKILNQNLKEINYLGSYTSRIILKQIFKS
jgi:hypothetical protein